MSVVGREYTISHIFHVNTVQIRQRHIQSRTTQSSIQTDNRTCSTKKHTMTRALRLLDNQVTVPNSKTRNQTLAKLIGNLLRQRFQTSNVNSIA